MTWRKIEVVWPTGMVDERFIARWGGEDVAEIRPADRYSVLGLAHYRCLRTGCGDNLGTADETRLRRVAREHQVEVHG